MRLENRDEVKIRQVDEKSHSEVEQALFPEEKKRGRGLNGLSSIDFLPRAGYI